MTVIEQLQQMTNENYNPTTLKNELEALFKKPENFKVYQEAIEHNCYLNTESGASLNNNVNLHVEQDTKTRLKQLILTMTDRYKPDKLLHFELVITGQSIDTLKCIVRKNDMEEENRRLVKVVRNCFGFYDENYPFYDTYYEA